MLGGCLLLPFRIHTQRSIVYFAQLFRPCTSHSPHSNNNLYGNLCAKRRLTFRRRIFLIGLAVTCSQILSLWLRGYTVVDSDIGLSYRPARLHIGWQNWFLGIYPWAPQKFKNSGSGNSAGQWPRRINGAAATYRWILQRRCHIADYRISKQSMWLNNAVSYVWQL